MKVIKINKQNPNVKDIESAAKTLQKGGVIVYPTDTSYGLAANALDEHAVKKVYEIKERDFSKPTHVVVRDWEMIGNLCSTNDLAKKLFDKFMPGPLTLILTKRLSDPEAFKSRGGKVPNILTASLPTLGVRVPDNPVTKALSNLVDFPYTTPSANKSGGATPYSIDEVIKQLDKNKIDLILDSGKLPEVTPSTIVDLSTTPPKILREGPIKTEEIKRFL
jgi:L-threonylcarbamoyladenylate synthase